MRIVPLRITSPAFMHNQKIPEKYTCVGLDVNPPLKFENIPKGTQSLVLICDDPDAPGGNWDHWILFNIPVCDEIKENIVPMDAIQGENSWGNFNYGGPCPPSGTHRYLFKLYALNSVLNPDKLSGLKKADIEEAMKGHIIQKAELIGVFKKN